MRLVRALFTGLHSSTRAINEVLIIVKVLIMNKWQPSPYAY